MYNASKVIPGIIILVVLLCTPILMNFANLKALPPSEPFIREAGQDKAATSEKCVAPVEYMRGYHMKLLDKWRTEKIREMKVYYMSPDGKIYVMSLQRTCLKCHKDYQKFCYKCHQFTGVNIDCFNCHIAGKEEIK